MSSPSHPGCIARPNRNASAARARAGRERVMGLGPVAARQHCTPAPEPYSSPPRTSGYRPRAWGQAVMTRSPLHFECVLAGHRSCRGRSPTILLQTWQAQQFNRPCCRMVRDFPRMTRTVAHNAARGPPHFSGKLNTLSARCSGSCLLLKGKGGRRWLRVSRERLLAGLHSRTGNGSPRSVLTFPLSPTELAS